MNKAQFLFTQLLYLKNLLSDINNFDPNERTMYYNEIFNEIKTLCKEIDNFNE